jgi:DNA polymerase-1
MPEELRQQMPVLKDVLDALNIPRYELEGWEADDLLGTISRKCEAAGWECVVVTGDKDSLQLVTDHTKVKLVSTRMGQTTTKDMTPETFREQYGFDPIHMIDLKALMGDTSDNIPGVPGVGEKTAMALIQKYESIENLYAKMPDVEVKPAALRKLAEGEESARHSYWLATIVTDAPLDFDPAENLVKEPGEAAYPLFVKLEFSKLMDRFGLTPTEETAQTEFTGTCTTELVTDEAQAAKAAQALRESGKTVFVRCEADLGLVVLHCETNEGGRAYVLDEGSFTGDYNTALKLLLGTDIPKAGHEIKDLMRSLLKRGVEITGWVFDTALAAYLLDATAGSYDLDRLTLKYCGFRIGRASDAGQEGEQLSLLDAPKVDTAKRYGDLAAEAAAIDCLREVLEPLLKKQNMWELYETAELPLCQVLAEMELAGCRVDREALSGFGEMLSGRISELETSIYDMAGETFNINSPKQLGEILFGKLGLPHGKKTKTGWSTNADVLEKLRYEAPIVGAVLEYRQFAKLKSTYADGLLKAMDPDGRVRTSFQMTVTATGRLSSTEPNLQNIPTRTDLGSEIRKMFVPEDGWVLVDADYSQIELRLLAHISGDEAMQKAFTSGADIHTATAAQVFHVDPAEVTHEMRRSAKAVNFGIVYGISAFSLSQDIGVSVADAKAYMEAYFATFPGVRKYMDAVVEQAKETGYVETLFHRRRDLPELKASNFNMRSFGERVALNMPIQGTAADVMKLAMVAVWKRLKTEKLQARLVLQVHDELIVECPEAEKETVAKLLEEEMEQVVSLSVPLTAEAHWGRNWLEAKG